MFLEEGRKKAITAEKATFHLKYLMVVAYVINKTAGEYAVKQSKDTRNITSAVKESS